MRLAPSSVASLYPNPTIRSSTIVNTIEGRLQPNTATTRIRNRRHALSQCSYPHPSVEVGGWAEYSNAQIHHPEYWQSIIGSCRPQPRTGIFESGVCGTANSSGLGGGVGRGR